MAVQNCMAKNFEYFQNLFSKDDENENNIADDNKEKENEEDKKTQ